MRLLRSHAQQHQQDDSDDERPPSPTPDAQSTPAKRASIFARLRETTSITRSNSNTARERRLAEASVNLSPRKGKAASIRSQDPFEAPTAAGQHGDDDDSMNVSSDEGIVLDESGRIDLISVLPCEISTYILLHCDVQSITRAQAVSRTWHSFATDPVVWRDHFHRQPGWAIKEDYLRRAEMASIGSPAQLTPKKRTASVLTASTGSNIGTPVTRISRRMGDMLTSPNDDTVTPRRLRSPSVPILSPENGIPSPVLAREPSAPLELEWQRLYRDRLTIERRWKAGTSKTHTMRGHTDSIYCSAFDALTAALTTPVEADGQKVITGSRDRTIKVWDLTTHACVRTVTGHTASVLCLRFDDEILVTGSSDHSVIVWSARDYSILFKLIGHNGGVLDVAFDQDWIVSASKDSTIRSWRRRGPNAGEQYRIMQGHRGPVNAVCVKDGKMASVAGDAQLKLWDIPTGQVERVFTGHTRGLACLAWSGDLLASGGSDRTIRVWNVKTGTCLKVLEGHTDLVRALALDAASGRLTSGSYDKRLLLHDSVHDTSTQPLVEFRKAHTSLIFNIAMTTTRLLSCSHDARVVALDFADGIDASPFV